MHQRDRRLLATAALLALLATPLLGARLGPATAGIAAAWAITVLAALGLHAPTPAWARRLPARLGLTPGRHARTSHSGPQEPAPPLPDAPAAADPGIAVWAAALDRHAAGRRARHRRVYDWARDPGSLGGDVA